jgi:hypothetical protein
MKYTKISFVLYLLVGMSVHGKEVNPETARIVGGHFLERHVGLPLRWEGFHLVYTFRSKATSVGNQPSIPYIYVFNVDSAGYVMVSADDGVEPILGYSVEGPFRPGVLPDNARKFFEGYISEIRYAIYAKLTGTPAITSTWQSLQGNTYEVPNQTSGSTAVAPLVKTKWNQEPHYNAMCPFDREKNQLTLTGCVATAMAQVMKYWNYPAKGSGIYSYSHARYGTLSANFGGTTYNWATMPNAISGSNAAVATLMYHCGVSVDMNYGVIVSGAYSNSVREALVKYFGYSPSARYVMKVPGYTDAQWVGLLRAQLDSAQPVYMQGVGTGGGHAFVCDGYDNSNLFHMNWGWGGASDGYFTITALNPGSLGAGGGTGGFNSDQGAVIGIRPLGASTLAPVLSLTSALSVTPDPIPYGSAFQVSLNLSNTGNGAFSGDYCVAIFNDSLQFVDYVQVRTGLSLGVGMTYQNNLTFSYSGTFSLLPGTYYLSAYARSPSGQWVAIANAGSLTNWKQIQVVNSNSIRLYSPLVVTPSVLIKGGAVSVNFNIWNTGSSTFTGQYMAGLYRMDGNGVQTIGTYTESTGLPSQYVYQTPFITLTNSLVTPDPGTYLLAIQHRPTGATNWQLTGTGNYQNPIKVVVRLPDLAADVFEPNNTSQQATALAPSFQGDSAVVTTEGSNCHVVNDYDYYRVTLPAGYNYTVIPRLHDSYNSANGKTYTLDALFSHALDGSTWSDAYDDELPGSVTVPGGRTLFLHVAPYFAGQTGTYRLDVRLKRTVVTSVNDPQSLKEIRIFPNPTRDVLYLQLPSQAQIRSWRYVLTDVQGRGIKAGSFTQARETLSLKGMPKGTYVVRIFRDNHFVRSEKILHE